MVWSRRKFVGAIAGGAVACQLVKHARATDSVSYGPFAVGMASYTLRAFPVDKAIELMQSLGVTTVDLNPKHIKRDATDEQISAVRKNCEAHGLKLLTYGVNNDITKDDEANRRLFEFAKKLGVRNLTVNPPEDALDSLEKLSAEYDIRVAIHNHGPGSRFDKVASVLEAIKGRHKNMGACADLGHYIRSGEEPARVITLLQGRLYGVHLKDFDGSHAKAKGCLLGKGQLDLVSMFKALKKVNFPSDACLSLEYEQHEKDPIADIKVCLATASDAAKKALG